MRKFLALLPVLIILVGCSEPTINAGRDVAAAAQGAIVAAQTQCKANPATKACSVLPQAISAQNLLVTSLETACGWNPSAPPADPSAKCVVVKGALPALTAATQNVSQILIELKGATGN
jgi:hypothetical protein